MFWSGVHSNFNRARNFPRLYEHEPSCTIYKNRKINSTLQAHQWSDDLYIAMVTRLVNGKDSSSDDNLIDPLFPNDFESDCWICESKQEST